MVADKMDGGVDDGMGRVKDDGMGRVKDADRVQLGAVH